MTPLQLALNLASDPSIESQAMAVAIVARGLSDDTEDRQGWRLSSSITAAIRHLGLPETPALVEVATKMAPEISDAILNKAAR